MVFYGGRDKGNEHFGSSYMIYGDFNAVMLTALGLSSFALFAKEIGIEQQKRITRPRELSGYSAKGK